MPDEGVVVDDSQAQRMLNVIADETAMRIVNRTHEQAQSAKDLAEVCDASLKTIYRRLETLRDVGLVSAAPVRERDDRYHTEYTTDVEKIEVTVEPDHPDVTVVLDEDDRVERFVDVWSELESD
ncbi:MAG: helix-turn-helix domain-containing protein [Halanaeroarchaeum sp.]